MKRRPCHQCGQIPSAGTSMYELRQMIQGGMYQAGVLYCRICWVDALRRELERVEAEPAPPQPIETRYQGWRFRSRLEARWAVFLDALSVEWEYEPQGFNLPSGAYLPDFWLPQSGAWLEVKPTAPTERERTIFEELLRATRQPGCIGIGTPSAENLQRLMDAGVTFEQRRGMLAVDAARSARFEHGESGDSRAHSARGRVDP